MEPVRSFSRNPYYVFVFLTKSPVLYKSSWFTNVMYQKHLLFCTVKDRLKNIEFINYIKFVKITGNFYILLLECKHVSVLNRFSLFSHGFVSVCGNVQTCTRDRCYLNSTPRSPTSFSLADSVVPRRPRRIAIEEGGKKTHSLITNNSIEYLVKYRS